MRSRALAFLLAILICAPALALDATRSPPIKIGPGSTGDGSGLDVTGTGQQPYGLKERADDVVEAMAYVPRNLRAGIRNGTNTTDLRPYLQAALNTGKRVHLAAGRWKICDKLNFFLNTGQVMFGDGVLQSVFDIGSCFNLGATAVVDLGFGDSSGIYDIGWDFDQSAAAAVSVPAEGASGYATAVATARSNLVQYPWALDIRLATRAKIGRLRFNKAYKAINCQGNCGGLDADLLEIGAFNTGIIEDGVFDFIHHRAIHCWPFGMGPTLSAVFYDTNSYCAIFGKVDGLDVASISTFRQPILFNTNGESGIARQILSVALDANGARIIHQAGDTQFGMISSTKDVVETRPTIDIVGGNVHTSNLRLYGAHGAAQVRNTSGALFVAGGWVQQVADKPTLISLNGITHVTGVYFQLDPLQVRTQPVVAQSGGGLYFMNNVIQQKSSGSGVGVAIGNDNAQVVVANNSFGGYGFTPPTGGPGVYTPNFKVGP